VRVFMHTALAAFVRLPLPYLCRVQAVHAIVQGYHKTGTYGKIYKE
jgi:hypothetical protein